MRRVVRGRPRRAAGPATGATAAGGGAAGTPETASRPAPRPETPVDFTGQPLWAYGFDDAAQARRETPARRRHPSRNLRPNEDAERADAEAEARGQRGRVFARGHPATAGTSIDWFPDLHPQMPDIIKLGPSQMKEGRRGCGSCHLPTGGGRPENAPVASLPPGLLHSAAQGLPQRLAPQRRPAQAQHQHDDRAGQGDDRPGDRAGRESIRRGHME